MGSISVATGREYPGCSKDGAHRVAAGWWSVGRRMMEVPGSRQNGGLQVAAGWSSPGRRRMEVSRSPQVCRSLLWVGGLCSHRDNTGWRSS